VPLELRSKVLILQNDVEGLIPRYVRQLQRHCTTNVRIQYNVEAADLGNQSEKIFDVVIPQIELEDFANIVRRRSWRGGRQLRRRLRHNSDLRFRSGGCIFGRRNHRRTARNSSNGRSSLDCRFRRPGWSACNCYCCGGILYYCWTLHCLGNDCSFQRRRHWRPRNLIYRRVRVLAKKDTKVSTPIVDEAVIGVSGEVEHNAGCLARLIAKKRCANAPDACGVDFLFLEADSVLNSVKIHDEPARVV